jgi:hypothetical protein
MVLPYNLFVMKDANATAASASDSNDGLDPSGTNITGGVYDDTGGANGDYSLTKTGAFAGCAQDDPIAITGGTAITQGLYPIKEVISDDEVLFYESLGSDATDVTTSDGPLLTFEASLSAMVALDRVVIGDGTYTHGTAGTWLTSTAAADFVNIYGANDRGVVDGTQPILSGASHTAATSTLTFSGSEDGWAFHNLRFTAGKLHNIEDATADTEGVSFYNCRIDNAATHNVLHQSRYGWVFEDTEIDNAGSCGVSTVTATLNDGGATYRRCRIHHNGSHGVQSSNPVQFDECLVYRNGGAGWMIDRNINGCGASRSLFNYNTAGGIETNSTTAGNNAGGGLSNCHFIGNDIGIDLGSFAHGVHAFTRITYCWFNDSGTANIVHPATTDLLLGEGGIDTNTYDLDPKYEDTTDGTEDFRPQEDSPLWAAGIAVAVR